MFLICLSATFLHNTTSNVSVLQFCSNTISTFISISLPFSYSHVALVTLNIRHDSTLFFFFFLPCGTKFFVKRLIRIVDGSVHDSEAVVQREHSSQTSGFVVPFPHTPFPMQRNVIFFSFSSPISSTK